MNLGQGQYSMVTRKKATSWSDVKPKLTDFDRAGLLRLIQDLCAASKDNQAFLHARFALGDDALARMFEQALKVIATLPEAQRSEFWSRLDEVRRMSHNVGYGVGDELDDSLGEHGIDG